MADAPVYDSSLFTHPELECDVIMKGGITSGVVYPLAVCELAQKYTFRNIGGTSAGAIAAALTAAAELGRTSPRGGFPKLAELPGFLQASLLSLFQPSPGGRAFFKILLTWIGPGGGVRKVTVSLFQLILRKILWFLAGAGLGAFVVYLLLGLPAATIHPRRVWVAWAVFVLAGGILGGLLGLVLGTLSALRGNFYGLCSGMPNGHGGAPALTPWLAKTLEETAGRNPDGPPLIFGDLWGKEGNPEDNVEDRRLNFEVMTTNLTWCRPMRLPFVTREFFFDPAEMARFFPEPIVQWLLDHPAPAREGPDQKREQAQLDLIKNTTQYRHLPVPAELPVIVAARMSLSFPVLFCAVPFYAVDWSRKANAEALKAGKAPILEQCWFSDGGIGSNFPVHFFDGLLPGRPTFGINLRPFHPDYPKQEDETKNVWFPSAAVQGIAPTWQPITGVFPFIGAILNTMQNWVDTAQTRLPGYRDRVIHISLTKEEGGMNLNMPEKRIKALSTRGKAAGQLLATEFKWDNHRWTRYLSAMAQLQSKLETMDRVYSAGFDQFLEQRDPTVTPYERTNRFKEFALKATLELMRTIRGWKGEDRFDTPKAPSPKPDLRIMPRL
jgi:predicted acylesterase/phospholipase RssA